MLQDITAVDMDNDGSTALTDEQLAEYGSMNPFIIYLEGGDHVKNKKVCAALVESVRSGVNGTRIRVRKQGVRKGVLGYNARASIPAPRLVPVLALVEESLVDAMLVSPAALALGMVAINGISGPNCMDLVDALVEEYEESAPIERQFFNHSDDVEMADSTTGDIAMTEGMGAADALTVMPHLGTVADGQLLDLNPDVHVIP